MGKILQELKLKKKPPLFCAGKSYQDINYVVWMYIFNITFLMLEHFKVFSFGSLLHRVNLSNSLSRHSLKTFINLSLFLNAWIIKTYACMYVCMYTAISRTVAGKICTRYPKGINMGYDQYCFWRLYLSNLLLLLSFSTRKHISTAFRTNSFKFL